MENLEPVPTGENLTAWRLGRVEKALEGLDSKLDSFNSVKETVLIHSEKLASLEKSRDRLVAGVSVIATGLVMLIVQQIFKVV